MAKKIKVSVILTSYNHAKYLREAIDSVLLQTFTNFELIIWDDASSDESWQIITSYSDKRIKSFRNDVQKRGVWGINKAISEIALGEYIAIHHSDDVWEPQKLEKQVAFLDSHPEIGAVFTNAMIIGEQGEPFEDKSNFYYSIFDQPNRSRYEWLNYFFYHCNALCHPSVLIRKICYEKCGLYRYGLFQLADFDMWVRLCLKYEIYVMPEKLVHFRIRVNALNTSAGNRPDARIRHSFETFPIYDNFRNIKTPQEFLKIFPTAQKYFAQKNYDLGFALGMVALEANTSNALKLFGLELLFEALNNPDRAKKIKELYGFSHKSYGALTGKYDVFSTELMAQLMEKDQNLHSLSQQLNEILSSKAWKFSLLLRNLRIKLLPRGSWQFNLIHLAYQAFKIGCTEGAGAILRKIRYRLMRTAGATFLAGSLYKWWILNNEPNQNRLAKQREAGRQFQYRPLVSIITPVYKTPLNILNAAIQSVIEQTYDHWELCIANGSPEAADLRKTLDNFARQDPRIKIVHLDNNLGIAGNTNAALKLATGDFIGFLDHDDLLAPFALFEVVKVVSENPAVDMIYSDEDKITADGRERHTPFFKPAFSPDFLEANNYMPHFLVVRRQIGGELGWIRDGFEGSQDYDLILRIAENAREIAHVPQLLYHWRAWPGSTALNEDAKSGASDSGIKALQEHLHRMSIAGTVHEGPWANTYRVTRSLTATPLVSIIIPNKDHAIDLKRCVHSILKKSSYKHFEIVIVENNSQENATFLLYQELQQDTNVRVIQHKNQPFNYSLVNNYGADYANGDILLLLNNDVTIITPDWLERMLEYILRPEVGIVGAKLYYPDDTIQHGGVIVGLGGVASHSHYHFSRTEPGYFCRLILPQNLSAVTGACLMIKKNLLKSIGGLDPGFVLAFGDIDLCLKVLDKGYLIVWTPYSELYHHESSTRGYEDTDEKMARFSGEKNRFKQKWSDFLKRGDDYYNPNLTLGSENFGINTDPVNNASVRIKPGFLKGVNK